MLHSKSLHAYPRPGASWVGRGPVPCKHGATPAAHLLNGCLLHPAQHSLERSELKHGHCSPPGSHSSFGLAREYMLGKVGINGFEGFYRNFSASTDTCALQSFPAYPASSICRVPPLRQARVAAFRTKPASPTSQFFTSADGCQ